MSTPNRPPWHNQPQPTRPPTPREEVNAIIDYSEECCVGTDEPLGLSVFGVFLRLNRHVDLAEKRAELQRAALRWLEERR
jgi:hypothetical protein